MSAAICEAAWTSGELARLFWTPLLGKKPLDAFLAEVFLCLIDGRPREAIIQGCVSDRTAIDLNGPDRLIFELNQIVGIEEVVFGEQGMTDFFRVAVESATGAQCFDFFWVGRHESNCVN
jgi:hypothetical protein